MLITEYIVPFLVELIGTLIIEEVKYLWGIKEQIYSLQLKLRYLQSFLRDVNESHQKQKISGNQLLQTHIQEITRLTHEIEHVIGVYRSMLNRRSFMKWIFRSCNLVNIHQLGVKIDRIQTRVQEATGILNDLGTARCISEEEDGDSSNIRSRL